MWSVCKKELRQFFSSLTGYIAIIVFLLVNGVMLFVFENNILDFGYATLDRFFQLAPWILLLLIPAITMRSFAEDSSLSSLLCCQPSFIISPFSNFLPAKALIPAPQLVLISGLYFLLLFLLLSVSAQAVSPTMR